MFYVSLFLICLSFWHLTVSVSSAVFPRFISALDYHIMASYRNEGRLTGLTTSGFQFLVQSLSKLDIFTRIGDEDVGHIS